MTARFDRLLRIAAVALLLALLASVVIGVASRLVNRPVTWSDEMAQHLLVWTGFCGWMIAARRRSHIRVDVLLNRLPLAVRRVALALTHLSVAVLALLMLRYGTVLIPRNWDVEWVSLPLSSGLLYLPMPFAAAAVCLQALADAVETLRARPPVEGRVLP